MGLLSHPTYPEKLKCRVNRIVSSLVTANPHVFLLNIARWLLVAIPATYTNSMLEYLQSELALAYRTR